MSLAISEPEEVTILIDEFIGQQNNIDLIKVAVESAHMRNQSVPHMLFSGPRGSGKWTLANIVAKMCSTSVIVVSCEKIKSVSELGTILNGVPYESVLIFKNMDRLKKDLVDILVQAMDDFSIDIVIGKGVSAEEIRLPIPNFTIIAVKDEEFALPYKLIRRFPIQLQFKPYLLNELIQIGSMYSAEIGAQINEEGLEFLSYHASGSQKKLKNLIKRAWDFAIVTNGIIDKSSAELAVGSM